MTSPSFDSPAALGEELTELEEEDDGASSNSSLDVVVEDEASSLELLGARALDLHVQVLSASSLTAPAYRPGDFARKLIFSDSSLLQNVYVKVRVGRVCGATQQVACHDHSVTYEDASLVFPYRGEEEISIAVKNGRSKLLYGAWCGNPFVGEGRIGVPKGSNESIVDVRLKREGFDGDAGVVSLKLQLVPTPQRSSTIESQFCLRLDRLSNANFNAMSLSERGPIGRRFYVKVQVFNTQGECVARAISHGVPDRGGFVVWDEVLTLPSHDNPIPQMHRCTFCTELSPSDWDLTTSTSKFSVYERNVGGHVFRDRCVGRAVIPLADLIEKPAIKFFISDSANNVVVADSIPHKPLELSVFVFPTTMPSAWPKPTEEEVHSAETYPRHIFMLTRGTRGDVQPFVALARGMAEQLGWLVTICTELRWKDFIKKNSNVARGRIRFRVSGGDTEARMKSWISKFALSSKTEVIQMLIMANAEVEFFSSSPVFMHHVTNMQNEPKPVDLLIFGMTCAGIAGVISERLNIPLMGFFLQPSCIPSSDPSWTAVVPSQTGNRLADYVQEKVFTSHGTLTLLKKFTEHNPYSRWNLDEIRSWYDLPKVDTWELFERLNVPIVIPIREGTFKRPDDWWQSIYLTDFIFLRQSKTAVEAKQALDEPVLSFVLAAKAAGSKLCLITFSSMPVPHSTMLSFVIKMLDECKFNNFRILYVGPVLFGTVPPHLQTKVEAMKQAGRFLEAERADFGVLFAEIDCFIVHGGLGTTVEALRIGRPICVTGPLLLDQRFWGAVVAEKGIGPPPVHFEYFERGCVDFVNGALDPTDPLGWQKNAKDQMSAWGDECDDGVGANIALFASLLSTLGRHGVKVSLLSALGATATTSFFSLLPSSINTPRGKGHVSVELRLGKVIKSSGSCPITMDSSADFSGVEPMIFPYNAEDGVVLTVREVHDVWIRGQPVIGSGIIGSGILPLSTGKVAAAAEDRKPHVEAVTISSKKSDKHSVTLMLQYEVVDCDDKARDEQLEHTKMSDVTLGGIASSCETRPEGYDMSPMHSGSPASTGGRRMTTFSFGPDLEDARVPLGSLASSNVNMALPRQPSSAELLGSDHHGLDAVVGVGAVPTESAAHESETEVNQTRTLTAVSNPTLDGFGMVRNSVAAIEHCATSSSPSGKGHALLSSAASYKSPRQCPFVAASESEQLVRHTSPTMREIPLQVDSYKAPGAATAFFVSRPQLLGGASQGSNGDFAQGEKRVADNVGSSSNSATTAGAITGAAAVGEGKSPTFAGNVTADAALAAGCKFSNAAIAAVAAAAKAAIREGVSVEDVAKIAADAAKAAGCSTNDILQASSCGVAMAAIAAGEGPEEIGNLAAMGPEREQLVREVHETLATAERRRPLAFLRSMYSWSAKRANSSKEAGASNTSGASGSRGLGSPRLSDQRRDRSGGSPRGSGIGLGEPFGGVKGELGNEAGERQERELEGGQGGGAKEGLESRGGIASEPGERLGGKGREGGKAIEVGGGAGQGGEEREGERGGAAGGQPGSWALSRSRGDGLPHIMAGDDASGGGDNEASGGIGRTRDCTGDCAFISAVGRSPKARTHSSLADYTPEQLALRFADDVLSDAALEVSGLTPRLSQLVQGQRLKAKISSTGGTIEGTEERSSSSSSGEFSVTIEETRAAHSPGPSALRVRKLKLPSLEEAESADEYTTDSATPLSRYWRRHELTGGLASEAPKSEPITQHSPKTPASKKPPAEQQSEKQEEAPTPEPLAKGKGKGDKGAPPPAKGKGKAEKTTVTEPRKPDVKPGVQVKRLFWNAFRLDADGNSVWGAIDREGAHIDIKELEACFADEPIDKGRFKSVSPRIHSEAKTRIQVLDEARRRQICVALARLPDKNATIDAVHMMDTTKLNKDQIELLQLNVPSTEEIKMLREAEMQYATDDTNVWDTAEDFIFALIAIPQFQLRLAVWGFRNSFQDRLIEISQIERVIADAFDRVMNSKPLRHLLGIILYVGNHLNGGTRRGRADGFTIDTLSQMRHVKMTSTSADNKGTLVDYIVRQMEKHYRGELEEIFGAGGDAEKVHIAAKKNLGDAAEELNVFRVNLDQLNFRVKAGADAGDDAFARNIDVLASYVQHLDQLQCRFQKLHERYQELCVWFHMVDPAQKKTTEEFFTIWDKFLQEIVEAQRSLEKRRLQRLR